VGGLLGVAGFEAGFKKFKDDRSKYAKIEADRDYVIPRYQQVFSPKHPSHLKVDEFRKFLRPRECRHWSCLNRSFPKTFRNTALLRNAVGILLDESLVLSERFDGFTKGLRGVGNAIATAILLITDPRRYGVWNRTSEAGLRELGLWPRFPRGSSQGQHYAEVNKVLIDLAEGRVGDLWMLDSVWWYVLGKRP
jgi:hypothetical protein